MRRVVAQMCAELDEARPRIEGRRRFRRIALPAALSLALAGGCEPTPIELPYMGPMPDGARADYRRPSDRGSADAGVDLIRDGLFSDGARVDLPKRDLAAVGDGGKDSAH